MNLNLALVKKNRRLRILILSVDGSNLFVDGRFAQTRHTQHATHDAETTRSSSKSGTDVVFKHGPHLSGRTWQENDCGSLMIDEHPGRSAIRVGKYFRVLDHHRLARVSLRHGDAEALEALADFCKDRF